MKALIANFGRENYLWLKCKELSTIATVEDTDVRQLWLDGNREGYIDRCVQTRKTASGRTLPRQVASRWFNLAHIISSTEDDLWIHRDSDKDELWWTISRSGDVRASLERTPDGQRGVWELHKPAAPWSNKSKAGTLLNWNALHGKAKYFLFTEGTLQQLSDDHAAYAHALISGSSLEPWHSRRDWKTKAEAAGRGAVTTFDARRRAMIGMAHEVFSMAAAARAQPMKFPKVNEVRFASEQQLAAYLSEVTDAQGGACAVTGAPLQYYGEHDDERMLCSLDRIDEYGPYEEGNLQIVCRVVAPETTKPTTDPAELERRVQCLRSLPSLTRPVGRQMPPKRTTASQSIYERRPDVKAWVLLEAKGQCELCQRPAPFERHNGEPYLEVHHVKQLAEGGPDTVENAAALCPSCHRRLHHGADRGEQKERLYLQISRLIRDRIA